MNDDCTGFVVCLVLLLLIGAALGGCWIRGDYERRSAIERGQGEYFINKYHDREWRWITNAPTQTP